MTCAETSNDSTVNKKESTQFKCPVCEEESVYHREAPNWGEWRRCSACGLIFANPLRLPEEPTQFFEKAYQGHIRDYRMERFHKRLLFRNHIEKLRLPPALDSSKGRALRWIKDHFPQGSYVLDIGCALGEFLDALRDAGFNPIGLDPSISVVERLRQRGHTAWHGTVNDIPPGKLPEISVCTSFLVLHHVVDPLGFLQSIRRRFPTSWLLISEATRWRPRPLDPPRRLTKWNKRSLQVALDRAGYDAEVIELDYGWKDFGLPGSDRLFPLIKNRHLMLLAHWVKPILFAPLALWDLIHGKHRLAFACAKPVPIRNKNSQEETKRD